MKIPARNWTLQRKTVKTVKTFFLFCRAYKLIYSCVWLAQEIAALRKEAQAFKKVRDALRSPSTSKKAPRMAFDKVGASIGGNRLVM
jgi:hypothetical protein